jgi:hypothetical protein
VGESAPRPLGAPGGDRRGTQRPAGAAAGLRRRGARGGSARRRSWPLNGVPPTTPKPAAGGRQETSSPEACWALGTPAAADRMSHGGVHMFRYERDSATATDDADDAGQPELHHRRWRRRHFNPAGLDDLTGLRSSELVVRWLRRLRRDSDRLTTASAGVASASGSNRRRVGATRAALRLVFQR